MLARMWRSVVVFRSQNGSASIEVWKTLIWAVVRWIDVDTCNWLNRTECNPMHGAGSLIKGDSQKIRQIVKLECLLLFLWEEFIGCSGDEFSPRLFFCYLVVLRWILILFFHLCLKGCKNQSLTFCAARRLCTACRSPMSWCSIPWAVPLPVRLVSHPPNNLLRLLGNRLSLSAMSSISPSVRRYWFYNAGCAPFYAEGGLIFW
jgi:hypothetical protein